MMTETPIDQALNELAHQYEKNRVKGTEPQYLGMDELVLFLESCGIEIDTEDRYELLLQLRSSGYTERKMDGVIKFVFWG
jgi:hypothetical protein